MTHWNQLPYVVTVGSNGHPHHFDRLTEADRFYRWVLEQGRSASLFSREGKTLRPYRTAA